MFATYCPSLYILTPDELYTEYSIVAINHKTISLFLVHQEHSVRVERCVRLARGRCQTEVIIVSSDKLMLGLVWFDHVTVYFMQPCELIGSYSW